MENIGAAPVESGPLCSDPDAPIARIYDLEAKASTRPAAPDRRSLLSRTLGLARSEMPSVGSFIKGAGRTI
jgi:hypothetical protein